MVTSKLKLVKALEVSTYCPLPKGPMLPLLAQPGRNTDRFIGPSAHLCGRPGGHTPRGGWACHN